MGSFTSAEEFYTALLLLPAATFSLHFLILSLVAIAENPPPRPLTAAEKAEAAWVDLDDAGREVVPKTEDDVYMEMRAREERAWAWITAVYEQEKGRSWERKGVVVGKAVFVRGVKRGRKAEGGVRVEDVMKEETVEKGEQVEEGGEEEVKGGHEELMKVKKSETDLEKKEEKETPIAARNQYALFMVDGVRTWADVSGVMYGGFEENKGKEEEKRKEKTTKKARKQRARRQTDMEMDAMMREG